MLCEARCGFIDQAASARALSIHCKVLRGKTTIQECWTVLIDAILDVAVGLESSGSGLGSRHGDLPNLFTQDG